jgi:hypothetical protein
MEKLVLIGVLEHLNTCDILLLRVSCVSGPIGFTTTDRPGKEK